MSDPYAPENLLKGGPSAPPPQLKQPDYLFPENFDQNFRRSWGERVTFHIGSAYLAGLTCGTAYGLQEGLRATAGERQRIRINGVLNAVGKQGPGLGNGLGCLAMMYSIFESLAYNVRGEDDLLNPIGAGVLSGAIYKSTAGVRMAGTAGISFGIFALAGAAASKELAKRGNTRLGKLF